MTETLPNPAIVAQAAVRRLPRAALWGLILAYVLPGFFGRGPWKHEDLNTYANIVRTADTWTSDGWRAVPWDNIDGPLTFAMGALAIHVLPGLYAHWVVRSVFAVLLLLTLACTWYACYNLARQPGAQPLTLAFGDEARPVDYARALADGALLALISSLGMAQLGHETTPALVQLCAGSLGFLGMATVQRRPAQGWALGTLGLMGLASAGAPTLAVVLGLGGTLLVATAVQTPSDERPPAHQRLAVWGLATSSLIVALWISANGWWRWRIDAPLWDVTEWHSLFKLLVWFTWPAAALAIGAVLRWRHQLLVTPRRALHLTLPLAYVGVAVLATLTTSAADRSLLLALPALATLASFALPTFSRSLTALMDWFTLLFFSGCAILIWLIWLAMQTGWPGQAAANLARLAPGFKAELSWSLWVLAMLATLAWATLVRWRIGRHQPTLWCSLALPAGGTTLCWLLLMTLWLPLLDYARSYAPLVDQMRRAGVAPGDSVCVQQVKPSQAAALVIHGPYHLMADPLSQDCKWRLINAPSQANTDPQWQWLASVGHPADRHEKLSLYRRQPSP